MADKGFEIIYVGHEGHDEAVGAVAEAPDSVTLVDPGSGLDVFRPDPAAPIALLAQTTLGMYEWSGILDEASDRYPDLWTARRSDLCYATTNRQTAVGILSERCDIILVVGSENSSNTQALVRVARKAGVVAHRVDGPDSIDPEWLREAGRSVVILGADAEFDNWAQVVDDFPRLERIRSFNFFLKLISKKL